jgi:arylsulfatase A-like enzyme
MTWRPRPTLLLLAAIAGGASLVAYFGCRAREGARPNVVLLTLDTLRADRLSAYGFHLPTSPFLEELAARGTLFERAYSAANVTKPAHASLLTGLYPKHHGLLSNNDALLNDAIETLPERFRDAGYATVAVVAVSLLDAGRSGLGQGFEVYADAGAGRRGRRGKERLEQRTAPQVVRLALEALGERPREPFFAWLHFYEPHTPYRPPAPYLQRFRDASAAAATERLPIAPFGGASMVRGAIPHSSALSRSGDPRLYEAAYHGEIAFLDDQLARLFAALSALDLERPLLSAITADHGEMLGEGGIYYNHASLEEAVVRVPLILVGPGVPEGRAIGEIVESVDLAPTLAALAGLPGRPAYDGHSLVPLLRGQGASDGLAFAQHSHDLAISLRDPHGTLLLPLPSSAERIVTPFASFDRRTYLAYLDLEEPRFSPWPNAADIDRPSAGGEAIADRQRRLLAWYRERRDYPPPRTEALGSEEIEELRALGYL